MAYNLISYFAIFLPAVIIIYQLAPQKYRFIVLLAADYLFFCLISRGLIVYLIAATFITYIVGLKIEKAALSEGNHKEIRHRKRKILAAGIAVNLLVLVVLKYTNFFGQTVFDIAGLFGCKVPYKPVKFLVPIGISFYTLEAVSYLTDVYRGTVKAEHNLAKVALFLSFFPQIMEGPIARFEQTAEALYSGKSITFDNLKFGYQRILWGLFKKMVIADRLYAAVTFIFGNYGDLDGSIVLFGAICYTGQLYMEFSGCMDIVMGSGEIFGVELPENFRQPFMAGNASEFWRRWHMTLGAFFKDYIFYPVSLAGPVKNFAKKMKEKFGKNVSRFVAPTAALFCVWACNGLWHGAAWPFIFYGMYYFVIIFIENITEEPVRKLTEKLHINRKSVWYRAIQMIKLFVIVITGEMFFRAPTLTDGFAMFGRIVSDFHISRLFHMIFKLGMDRYDCAVVAVGVAVVTIVGIFKEKNISIRSAIANWKAPARWALWYAAFFAVMIAGAYGSGYAAVDLIYAGY